MDEGRARAFSESEDETRDHEDAEAGGEHERQHSERPYERENDQQSGHRSGSAAGFGAELRGESNGEKRPDSGRGSSRRRRCVWRGSGAMRPRGVLASRYAVPARAGGVRVHPIDRMFDRQRIRTLWDPIGVKAEFESPLRCGAVRRVCALWSVREARAAPMCRHGSDA